MRQSSLPIWALRYPTCSLDSSSPVDKPRVLCWNMIENAIEHAVVLSELKSLTCVTVFHTQKPSLGWFGPRVVDWRDAVGPNRISFSGRCRCVGKSCAKSRAVGSSGPAEHSKADAQASCDWYCRGSGNALAVRATSERAMLTSCSSVPGGAGSSPSLHGSGRSDTLDGKSEVRCR